MPGISADLTLDYSDALANAETLASQLTDLLDSATQASAESFVSSFQDAISTVAAETVDIPIQVDESAIVNAEAAVQQLAEPIDVPIEVDDSAIEDASSKLDDLSASADSASSSTEGLTKANAGLEAAAGLAVGEVGGLKSAAGELGGGAAAAAGGVAILGGGIFELYQQGLNAVSATQRFNLILGDMKERVEQVHVGDLNTTLDALTKKMGDTRYQTETAAATIFQFSQNAGASREQSAQFTDSLFALASRAVALNPALGSVSDVAARMEIGLGRARSAAQQFGISISQAEINTRAMKDTGASSASELTAYEKSVAGAEIALERYGSTLSGTVAKGSQNAAIQQRVLTAEFDQFLEDVGKQLVIPALDALKAGIPIGESFAKLFAEIGTSVIPAVAESLKVVAPIVDVVAQGLEAMGPVLPSLTAGFLAFEAVTYLLLPAFTAAVSGANLLIDVLPLTEAAAESAAAGIEAAEIGVQAALGPIGLLAAGLGIAATSMGLFGNSTESASDQAKKFADQIAKTSDASLLGTFNSEVSQALARTLAAGDGFSKAGIALDTFRKIADDNVGAAQRLVDAMQRAGLSTKGYQQALDQAVASQKSQKAAQDETSASTKALTTSTVDQTISTAAAAKAIDAYGTSTGTAADAVAGLDAASSALKSTLDLLLGRFLSGEEAEGAFQQAIAAINFEIATGAQPLDAFTTAATSGGQEMLKLGDNASSAAEAILRQTNNVGLAVVPLQQYRAEVQQVRDSLAAQGLDTTFLDSILGQVDSAIAGVKSKDPDAQAAGKGIGDAVTTGVTNTWDGAKIAGQGLGIASYKGGLSTLPEHAATGSSLGVSLSNGIGGEWFGALGAGAGLGNAGWGGAAATRPSWVSTGASLGGGLADGIGGTLGDVLSAVGSVVDAAVSAAHDKIKNPPFPSAVTRELGVSFGMGLVQGIASTEDAVSAAAISLAGAAVVPASREVTAYAAAGGGVASRDVAANALGSGTVVHAPISVIVQGAMSETAARQTGQRVGASAGNEIRRVIGALT